MERRKSYACRFTPRAPEIRGDFSQEAWRRAEPLEFILPLSGRKPLSPTTAGLLWDEEYLYVGYRAHDLDIFALHTERDASTCDDDVLEIFFKTDPGAEPYYNFEINALNTVYDAYNLRRKTAGGGRRWRSWNCPGLKSAVSIEGTINDPSDRDRHWQLEIAIPFRSLVIPGRNAPEAGDRWLFHLARYDHSVYLPEGVELSSTALMDKVDFHRFESWDTLVFEKG